MKKILAIVLCLVMVLSLLPTVSFAADQKYTKVTAEQEDWSGQYLITYVAGTDTYVFAGIDKPLSDGGCIKTTSAATITATDEMCAVQIDKLGNGYSIKLLSGTNANKYLNSKSSYSNGLVFSDTPVKLSITYSDGHPVISNPAVKQSDKELPLLFYHNGNMSRFRFYASNQAAIDLYKLSGSGDSSHTCDFAYDSTVAPTCIEKGYDLYKCECGNTEKRNETDLVAHNFVNNVCSVCKISNILKDGAPVIIYVKGEFNVALSSLKTKKEDGSDNFYNKPVDVSENFDAITSAEIWTVTKVSDGIYKFTCGDVKLALGSSYASLNATGENDTWALYATGTEGAFYLRNVGRGNYLEYYSAQNNWSTFDTSNLDAQFEIYFQCPHLVTEVKNAKNANCVEDGYTGDTYCKNCGEKLITGETIHAKGHTGGTATCTEKAECSVCHEKYGDLADHKGELTWVEQGEGHIQKYSVCGCTVGEVEDHDHAGENGVCSKCGHGCEHTGGTATCDKQAVCEKCNNPYGEVNQTNHSGETELKNDKEATCGAAGYTGDTYCKGCGEKLEDGKEIPATGKHVDEGKDHKCDVCEAPVGEHKAAEGSHKCGYCGETLSQCADTDKDGKCDICGAAMETKPDDKDDTKPDDKEDDKKDDKPVTDPNSITAQLVTSLKDGMHIIIYNPGDGVINTGVEYEYVNSNTGKSKWELKTAAATVNGKTLTAAKADACILTVKRVNGHYSFVNADGKYLYMDTNDVKFVDEAGDYTLFDLEKAEGGFFIKSVNAVYTSTDKDTNETINKPQYLELYLGCLTVYRMNSSKPELYTFQFYTTDEVNSESGDPIAMVLGLMAVSGLGITVLKKKEH